MDGREMNTVPKREAPCSIRSMQKPVWKTQTLHWFLLANAVGLLAPLKALHV